MTSARTARECCANGSGPAVAGRRTGRADAVWSALRRSGVAGGPLERVVGYLLPAGLDAGEVGPVRKLVDVSRRRGVAVLLRVRALHRGRHQMVLSADDEQQRGTVVQVVVDPGLLVARLPVGDQAVGPHPVAGRGDVEAVVGCVG